MNGDDEFGVEQTVYVVNQRTRFGFVGSTIRCWAKFRTSEGDPVDPDTVSFIYLKPQATMPTTLAYGTDDEVEKMGVGHYRVELSPASGETGRWVWRWQGTGDHGAVNEGDFVITPSAL